MKKIKTLVIVLMLIALPSTSLAYDSYQLREMQIKALQNTISLLIEQVSELNKQLLAQIQVKEVVGLSLENPNRDMFPTKETVIIESKNQKEGWYNENRPCEIGGWVRSDSGNLYEYRFNDKQKKCYKVDITNRRKDYNPPTQQSCPKGYEYYKSAILKNYGNGIVGKCRKL